MAGRREAALTVNIVADATKATQGFDKAADAGQRMATTLQKAADKAEEKLATTKAMADSLAKALGPDMAKALGQSTLDSYARKMYRAGLTIDDVQQNAEELTKQMARLEAASEQAATATGRIGTEADKSRSVMANFTGNALQEIPGLSGAFGPLNMAIGQFGEYAAEGDIKLKGLAANVGAIAGIGLAIGVVSQIINSMGEAQRQVEAQTERTSQAIKAQIETLFDWQLIGDQLGTTIDQTATAQDILNQSLIETVRDGGAMLGFMAQLGLGSKDVYETLAALDADPTKALTGMARTLGLTASQAATVAAAVKDMETNTLTATDAAVMDFTPAMTDAYRVLEFMQDRAEDVDLTKVAKETLDQAAASDAAAAALIRQAEAFVGLSRDQAPQQVLDMFITLARNAQTANSALNESGQALRDTADRMWELWDAQAALIELQTGQRSAQRSWQQAMTAAATTVDDATTPWNEQTQAIDEAMAAAGQVASTYSSQQQQLAGMAGTTYTATQGIYDQIVAYETMAATLGPNGPLQTAMRDYINMLWAQIKLQDIIANQQGAGGKGRYSLGGDRAQEYRAIGTASAFGVPVMQIPGAGLIPGLQENAGMGMQSYPVNLGGVVINMPPGASGDDIVRALQDWMNTNGGLPLQVDTNVRR